MKYKWTVLTVTTVGVLMSGIAGRATFFNVGYTLSFNVVMLVLAFYLPYSLLTSIISSSASPAVVADKALFSSGLDNAYRVLAVINTAAIVPSLLWGRRAPQGWGTRRRFRFK